jgi:hypothetical protein
MQNVGSRASVMYGMAKKTSGGLTKDDLMYNEKGKIVSKKKSMMARKNMRGGSGQGVHIEPLTVHKIIYKNKLSRSTSDRFNPPICPTINDRGITIRRKTYKINWKLTLRNADLNKPLQIRNQIEESDIPILKKKSILTSLRIDIQIYIISDDYNRLILSCSWRRLSPSKYTIIELYKTILYMYLNTGTRAQLFKKIVGSADLWDKKSWDKKTRLDVYGPIDIDTQGVIGIIINTKKYTISEPAIRIYQTTRITFKIDNRQDNNYFTIDCKNEIIADGIVNFINSHLKMSIENANKFLKEYNDEIFKIDSIIEQKRKEREEMFKNTTKLQNVETLKISSLLWKEETNLSSKKTYLTEYVRQLGTVWKISNEANEANELIKYRGMINTIIELINWQQRYINEVYNASSLYNRTFLQKTQVNIMRHNFDDSVRKLVKSLKEKLNEEFNRVNVSEEVKQYFLENPIQVLSEQSSILDDLFNKKPNFFKALIYGFTLSQTDMSLNWLDSDLREYIIEVQKRQMDSSKDITPVQILSRYELILRDIIQKSNSELSDYSNLNELYLNLQRINKKVDESINKKVDESIQLTNNKLNSTPSSSINTKKLRVLPDNNKIESLFKLMRGDYTYDISCEIKEIQLDIDRTKFSSSKLRNGFIGDKKYNISDHGKSRILLNNFITSDICHNGHYVWYTERSYYYFYFHYYRENWYWLLIFENKLDKRSTKEKKEQQIMNSISKGLDRLNDGNVVSYHKVTYINETLLMCSDKMWIFNQDSSNSLEKLLRIRDSNGKYLDQLCNYPTYVNVPQKKKTKCTDLGATYVKNKTCTEQDMGKPCRSTKYPKLCKSINGKTSETLFTYGNRKDKTLIIDKNFTGQVPKIQKIPE